jgi:hypothetical protein
MSYQKKLAKMGLSQMVMGHLKKPVYPFTIKGRHKKDLVTNILKFF